MKRSLAEISTKISTCYEQFYLPAIKQQLAEQQERMTLIFDLVKAFNQANNERVDHQSVADYKRELHQLVGPMWEQPEQRHFFPSFEGFEQRLKGELEQVDEVAEEEQSEDRFYISGGDSIGVKSVKLTKRFLFGLHRLPSRLSNIFRQKPTVISYWQHRVPLRNLAVRYFQLDLIIQLEPIDELLHRSFIETYLKLKLWEEGVINRGESDPEAEETLEKMIKGFEKRVFAEVSKIWVSAFETADLNFQNAYPKVGTLEFPNGTLKPEALAKAWSRIDEAWGAHQLRWLNTIYALFEEWRSDLDIYTLQHQTLAQLNEFQSAQIKRLGEQIGPEVQEIEKIIDEMKRSVSGEPVELKKVLTKINYQTKKQLDQVLIPKLTEKLSSQYILNLIGKLELNVQQSVESLSKAHVVVQTKTYDAPMETKTLQRISPYELIAFETLGYFQNDWEAIKKGLFETLEQANEQIADLDHIITFSVKAALSVVEDEDAEIESQRIALEGLERAQLRLQEAKQTLEENLQQLGEEVTKVIFAFCERIMELTENENIRELRARINKAKSAHQREERRLERRLALKGRKEQLFSYFQRTVNQAEELIEDISTRLLLTPGKRLIDKEVSDLLVDSREIIDQLPLVYQRLYSIEPLQDLELFEGRQVELEQLQTAFDSWEKGRFAATIVFGEKWGGQTSFMTYAIQTSKFPYQVIRHGIKEAIHSEADLVVLLRILFKHPEFETLDEVKEYLINGPRRVVVLEDLQNVFLRTVGGFAGIQILLRFINETCKELFWVTTTTLYSWQYLTKTIAIHDFFSYPIQMQSLSDEEITNIVWKRNRISGYKIQFTASDKRLVDKKFKNLTEDEQQLVLKRDFFAALNAFANSNISLALIFWLLSTREVKGNTLIMGAFKKPDFSFMNALSADKIHALNAMIIHDGLTENQLQRVLNASDGALKMTLLSLIEDGILFVKEEVYMVNAMLYRSTIAMLKDKNLIH